MAKKGFSIKYEQTTDMPLKISPKNTWVKINTFDTPCRLLEISTQSLNIEIKNLPEASTMQAGNNIKIQVLNASGEDPLVLHVTIFHINDTECLCQVPLYVDSEQILLDKIVLEIQKNEIGDKHFSSFARNNDNSDNAAEQNYNVATSDEDIASILNNLVAMLPNETKDSEEEKVVAHSINNIPKSSFTYQQQPNFARLFETADDDNYNIDKEKTEHDSDKEENLEDGTLQAEIPSVNPLTLLRYSIVNKFLLDGLKDPYPNETKKLEDYNINIADTNKTDAVKAVTKNFKMPQKVHKKKKAQHKPANDISNFLPTNLITEMNAPGFMADIERTNEYNYNLTDKSRTADKDAAFDEYYEFSSELPPELIFALMEDARKKKEEYDGLDTKYQTDEFGFTMIDEDDYDASEDEASVLGRFDKLLENKRNIHFNVNNDPDYIAMTDEEKDEAFIEKLNNQNQDQNGEEKTFNFKLDI